MGCDIHFYVEKKQNGKWVSADKWKKEEGEVDVPYKESFYRGRNYNLFSILADVRNGTGFAGIETGKGFVPIALPRGVPEDASPEYKKITDKWEGDGHSHSHLTLAELLAYDWTQVTQLCGWINAKDFYNWSSYARADGDSPDGWCGEVGGGRIKKISIAEMELIAIRLHKMDYKEQEEALETEYASTYTYAEWKQPYYKTARDFLGLTMPRLWRLGKPEDVRIVFFFDN